MVALCRCWTGHGLGLVHQPLLYHRNIVPLWIATDAAALIGLLYVIDALSPRRVVCALALPIALTQSVLTLLIVRSLAEGSSATCTCGGDAPGARRALCGR